jgi:hypothetical protein
MENQEPDDNLENIIDKLDPKYFFFDFPLYEVIDLNDSNISKVRNLLNFGGSFDAYNFIIKDNTTFEGDDNYSNTLYEESHYYDVNIKCSRSKKVFRYFIRASETSIQKVGQFPSLADLNIEQVKKYESVLSREKLKEFIRGIGLRAHGVGIGSFVYLRRIFEYLIEKEHIEAKKGEAWNDDLYEKSRMIEKIELLKNCLPEFLVENKDLYGILSLGVHELSEDECLKYFDPLKMGIIEVLEEKVIEKQREDRKKQTQKSIQIVREKISDKKN